MGQLNVTVDDAMLAGIDRLAAERAVNRQELVRALVRKAMGAEGGREPAPAMQSAAGVPGLAEMVGHLRQLSIDLERSLRDQDRREARLQRRDQRDGQDGRQAQSVLLEQVRRQLGEGLAPLQSDLTVLLDQLQAEAAARPDPLPQPDDLAHIEQSLERLTAYVREVRPQVTYQFGKDWTLDFWTLVGSSGIIILIAFSLLIGFARLAPDSLFAVPLARGMFGSSERASCVLDGGEYYAGECHRYASRGGGR